MIYYIEADGVESGCPVDVMHHILFSLESLLGLVMRGGIQSTGFTSICCEETKAHRQSTCAGFNIAEKSPDNCPPGLYLALYAPATFPRDVNVESRTVGTLIPNV